MLVRPSADLNALNSVIITGLRAFNRSALGPYEGVPVGIELVNSRGEIVGGAAGVVSLGWLSIEIVFLGESIRGQRHGTAVLSAIEAEGRRLGARNAMLDTMGFQAEGFYVKAGYTEFGRLPDYVSGHDRIYLRKSLA